MGWFAVYLLFLENQTDVGVDRFKSLPFCLSIESLTPKYGSTEKRDEIEAWLLKYREDSDLFDAALRSPERTDR